MSVLSQYLNKHALYPNQINTPPSENLGLVIVIPCYNEENIITILQSIYDCERPQCDVEVLVVINSPSNADINVLETNNARINDFNIWTSNHKDHRLRYYLLHYPSLPPKDAGVGLARKLGMDQAIYRYLHINYDEGIIANIDADCTCKSNYLTSIEKLFTTTKTKACSIRFEHPIEGDLFSTQHYDAIIQYELYLHYYILSLRKTGHPFAFHTIGSSFAVSASTYAKQGGMNKRKAGEDFYFLQKIIPLGKYSELNNTCVYPSPRKSQRVPFGTGAAITKMLNSNNTDYYTYDIQAFEDLKYFFEYIFHLNKETNFEILIKVIKDPLKSFLIINNMANHLAEIQKNTSTPQAFIQRFFRWFNAFVVLKYMNFSHEQYYQRKPIAEMAKIFLNKYENINVNNLTTKELLLYFRKLIYDT